MSKLEIYRAIGYYITYLVEQHQAIHDVLAQTNQAGETSGKIYGTAFRIAQQ